MPVEIKNRFTQEVILVVEAESLGHVDLSGLNLEGADLSGLNLIRANLSGANLEGADLSGAFLRYANLSGANLEGANIEGADLFDADLIGVKILIEGHKIVILNQQEEDKYIKRPYLYQGGV